MFKHFLAAITGNIVSLIGTLLIYIAAALTVYSMFVYLRMAWPHLDDR